MAKSHFKEEYQEKLGDDKQINQQLGKNLCRTRLKAKKSNNETITFEWLSNLTTLHSVSIWRFEKGMSGMTVASLVRLKDALGCSWEDLLEGCESEIVKARKPRLRK